LYLEGRDLRREPLIERKRLLAGLLAGQPHGFPIHYSLILGEYRDGKLAHVGRAGTGYTAATARQLWEKLHPLEIDKAPFAADALARRWLPHCWCEPPRTRAPVAERQNRQCRRGSPRLP
jgi:ATP-dependent DNA ligase